MNHLRNLALVFLFLMVLSCSDESLVGVDTDATETLTASDARLIEGIIPSMAQADPERVLWVAALDYFFDPEAGVIPCVDADGNPSDFVAAVRLAVTGKTFFLGETTGELIFDQCVANADGTLTATGTFDFTGAFGDGFGGTFTVTLNLPVPPATTAPLKVSTQVTHGTGRFAGANGWSRGIGENDFATATGKVYLKGLISMPKQVELVQFQGDFTTFPDTTAGIVPCLDEAGNTVPGLFAFAQGGVSGLAMHLGVVDVAASSYTVEGCTVHSDGSISNPTSGTVTGATGDAITASTTLVTLPDGTITANWMITGGAGRFEGATGWFTYTGTFDLATAVATFTADGWIYAIL